MLWNTYGQKKALQIHTLPSNIKSVMFYWRKEGREFIFLFLKTKRLKPRRGGDSPGLAYLKSTSEHLWLHSLSFSLAKGKEETKGLSKELQVGRGLQGTIDSKVIPSNDQKPGLNDIPEPPGVPQVPSETQQGPCGRKHLWKTLKQSKGHLITTKKTDVNYSHIQIMSLFSRDQNQIQHNLLCASGHQWFE